MKKILFLILCLFAFSPSTKAFLGEDLGINLYKNINDGINELELKQYEYELKGQGKSIKDNFNKILKSNGYPECIENELSSEQIDEISNGNIALLYENISPNCLDETEGISNLTINNIQKSIKNINELTKKKAINKSDKINSISKIGIYSDGISENSPFDLITDLQNIDYYIFTEQIPYNGEVFENNDDIVNSIMGKNLNNNSIFGNGGINTLNKANYNGVQIGNNNTSSYNNTNGTNSNNDSLNCIDDAKNSKLSGLNEDEINKLLSNSGDSNNSNSGNSNTGNTSKNNNSNSGNINNNSINYKKINDNGVYPCTTFFCITIEFITYQHNLFGGGNNVSIEYLVNRSNNHLKKFAATSLVQSEMTSNNWELGLKDLNLTDTFHMGFIITNKPVPILDLVKDEDKEKKTEFTKNNLLEKYYKNYGLEYSRKNDLNNFNGQYDELKNVLDLAELANVNITQKINELNEVNNKRIKQNDFVSKAVFEKIGNDELADFEKRFIELNKFTTSIYDYIRNIDSAIRFMNKIKIDKG